MSRTTIALIFVICLLAIFQVVVHAKDEAKVEVPGKNTTDKTGSAADYSSLGAIAGAVIVNLF